MTDTLVERLDKHIESLEAHGVGNTEPMPFDDLCELSTTLKAQASQIAELQAIINGCALCRAAQQADSDATA